MRRMLLMLAMVGALLGLATPAQAQYQPGTSGFILDPPVVDPGGTTTVIGTGCPRNSVVEVTIEGGVVGTTIADDNESGSFQVVITAPQESGDYIVTVTCGNVILTQVLTVTPTSCAFTVTGAPGSPVSASVPGFQVGSAYTLIFQSDPVQVGQGTVVSDPQPVSFTIPSNAEPGAHILSIAGTATNGQAKVLDCPAQVTASVQAGALPRTGGDEGLLVKWAVGFLAVGGLLALAGRRRSVRSA